MAIVDADHLTSQAPPAKRARLDQNLELSATLNKMDTSADTVARSGIPGLGLLGNASKVLEQTTQTPVRLEVPEDQSAPASVQEKAGSPVDLLCHLEAALVDPQDVQRDLVMEEAPAQDSSQATGVDPETDIVSSSNGNINVDGEKPHESEATADEPTEEVKAQIEDGEQRVKGIDGTEQNTAPEAEAGADDEHPEWEVDSSPIESSSDESSSEDSSSEDSDEEGEDAYKLLDPEEQARILMEGDGGSDDEGGNKGAKGSGGQLRTKNEVPEEVIVKPDVTITPEMKIEELGTVEGSVENTVLIKAKTSGEYRVLESGSVLCLEDRRVIGAVAETIGRVQQPFYSVRFTNAAEIGELGIAGTKVFYSEQHSTYVFTQALKAYKGSDASNLHDEEVGDDEIEFSDDEAEAEHKRVLKQKKMEKRGGKVQQNGNPGRGGHGHPLRQDHSAYDSAVGINYDDDEDGPYKPLARPAGFANSINRSEAPEELGYSGRNERSSRGEQSRGRGRGDRGRGRGRGNDRGRGKGGSGYSQPSHSHPSPGSFSKPPQGQGHRDNSYSHPAPSPTFSPPQFPLQGYPNQFPIPPFYNPQSTQQAPPLWPQFPPPPAYQQHQFAQPYMQPEWSNNGAGAFINPAFFNGAPQNQWNQQGGGGNDGKRC